MRQNLLKFMLKIIVMVFLAAVSAGVTSTVLWDSPVAGIAVLRGEYLRIDCINKSFGSMPSNATAELQFVLTNLSKRPVRVLGGDGSCDCTIVDAIPTIVSPRSKKAILVRVRLKGKQGPFLQSIRLYTSSPKQPEISLTITGDVTQAEARALPDGGTPLTAFLYGR